MENDIRLYYEEVPPAYSMFRSAGELPKTSFTVFPRYILTWTAFNSIYSYKAECLGLHTSFKRNKTGGIEYKENGQVRIPQVQNIPEWQQIQVITELFPIDLQRNLIVHSSTNYFACRTPRWKGHDIKYDGQGQLVNGVINISRTLDRNHPVWSPIDTEKLSNYEKFREDKEVNGLLSKQIVNVLYTIRNNLIHGSKSTDDAWDEKVVTKALPLLELIVAAFLR